MSLGRAGTWVLRRGLDEERNHESILGQVEAAGASCVTWEWNKPGGQKPKTRKGCVNR